VPTAPPGEGPGIASAAPGEVLIRRADLIGEIFSALAGRQCGTLGSAEMRRFATLTGFEGSDAQWREEFQLLCEEKRCNPSRGIDQSSFLALVNDESDAGCYCNDGELQEIHRRLVVPAADRTTLAAMATPQQQGRQRRPRRSTQEKPPKKQKRCEAPLGGAAGPRGLAALASHTAKVQTLPGACGPHDGGGEVGEWLTAKRRLFSHDAAVGSGCDAGGGQAVAPRPCGVVAPAPAIAATATATLLAQPEAPAEQPDAAKPGTARSWGAVLGRGVRLRSSTASISLSESSGED